MHQLQYEAEVHTRQSVHARQSARHAYAKMPAMKNASYRSVAVITAVLLLPTGALSASSVPPFEVAYRAWELVTQLARRNADPGIGGQCARTFRPFVSAGLRMQTRQEQDIAAVSCLEAARSACASSKLRAAAETAKKCEEFR
jgi:hypothetical protein